MTHYTPDSWLIIKVTYKEGDIDHRILGGWSGGYLEGTSWRLSSGIVSISYTDEYGSPWHVRNKSGSVYSIGRRACRETIAMSMGLGVLARAKEKGEIVDYEILTENDAIEYLRKLPRT